MLKSINVAPMLFNFLYWEFFSFSWWHFRLSVLLQLWNYDSWILWLGHIILFILKEDFNPFESRHYIAFLWELHSYYLPTAGNRCLICVSNLLRPDKSEPTMKLDSTWDFLSHFCTSFKTAFAQNNLSKDMHMANSLWKYR